MERQSRHIRERALYYSLRAIRLYQALQERKDGAGWILAKQYLRSASAIGACLEEAQAAERRADFVHKHGIEQEEARESIYWLKLLALSGLLPVTRLRPLLKETEELYAVITAIICSAKDKSKGRS
jgi:four helix bundle protein